jgi:hypothetical protein
MKGNRILWICTWLTIMTMFAVPLVVAKTTKAKLLAATRHTVKIAVHNPYSFRVKLEVKCDWDGKRYRLHKIFWVSGHRKTIINVPNSLRKCEVWPKVKFF